MLKGPRLQAQQANDVEPTVGLLLAVRMRRRHNADGQVTWAACGRPTTLSKLERLRFGAAPFALDNASNFCDVPALAAGRTPVTASSRSPFASAAPAFLAVATRPSILLSGQALQRRCSTTRCRRRCGKPTWRSPFTPLVRASCDRSPTMEWTGPSSDQSHTSPRHLDAPYTGWPCHVSLRRLQQDQQPPISPLHLLFEASACIRAWHAVISRGPRQAYNVVKAW